VVIFDLDSLPSTLRGMVLYFNLSFHQKLAVMHRVCAPLRYMLRLFLIYLACFTVLIRG